RKQRQRSALHPARRPQPYLALTLEERARNPPANVFRKRECAVVQIKVEIRPVNRGVPNVVHPARIEPHRTNPRVKPARSLRTLEAPPPCPRPGRRGHKGTWPPDHPPQPSHPMLHRQFSVPSSQFSEKPKDQPDSH